MRHKIVVQCVRRMRPWTCCPPQTQQLTRPRTKIQRTKTYSSNVETHRSTKMLAILQQVERGELSAFDAEVMLKSVPPDDATLESFANLDHNRSQRTGFPEAVFGQGKSAKQILSIMDNMAMVSVASLNDGVTKRLSPILATRVSPELYEAIGQLPPPIHCELKYYETARIIVAVPKDLKEDSSDLTAMRETRRVVIASAGTTDLPVAEEAAITLELASISVERIYDVGVAGLHRIVRKIPQLTADDVGCIIVVAGMDGALPSVVGGLARCPVVACPTSVGYGAALQGIGPLLTMLNACAPGVAVVNIDNGFGAAAFAYKCLQISCGEKR